MKLLVFLLGLAVALPAFAQEKKTEKKSAQKKKSEPKQDWGHFSSGAKKDQKAMAQKKAAEKK